jgi:catechol-2,3-dioxygenase
MHSPSPYDNNSRPAPIRAPKLHHATFMTFDVAPMAHWYEMVCGLRPIYFSSHAAWLTNDEANHRIALLRIPGTQVPVNKPHTAGLHHTAFEYETFDQWLDNYIRLRDVGILPVFSLDHGMTMSMYYQDPDGNGVEIQVDNFHDWGKSSEWMWASKEFAEDQVGPAIDPEKLVAARESGLDGDQIHTRAYAGEYLPAEEQGPPMFPDVWPARVAANPWMKDGLPLSPDLLVD